MDQNAFVSKEAIPVAVKIINHSGQTLSLGKEVDWLAFTVETTEGFVLSPTDKVPVVGEFDLATSKYALKRVDLAPYFEITKTGEYMIIATVKIKDWEAEVSSAPKKFQITRGTKLWEGAFGMPMSASNAGPPVVRKYILQQSSNMKQMKLYVRVTDEMENHVFKVVPVGPLLSFSRPEPRMDQQNNLHLIYQSGARRYLYSVVTPDGAIIQRQTFDVTGTRPHLHVDGTGKISVVDGQRHIMEDDINRPDEQVISNGAPSRN